LDAPTVDTPFPKWSDVPFTRPEFKFRANSPCPLKWTKRLQKCEWAKEFISRWSCDRPLTPNCSASNVMALWRLYYHLVWATKNREALISLDQESNLYNYIIGKSDTLGCITHAIGGTANHIHLVTSIPPSLSISDFVKTIKGSSSHHLNQSISFPLEKFQWQEGYGVFSLGGKQLEHAINYVKHQKEHHAQGTIISALEDVTPQDDPPKSCTPVQG
jgi:putative transposase